ncbi:ABC transporter ATP-binding protein [Halarcobacter anaerophilus]|jgi:ABC-type Fe3+/spermidine/putrescine transport system ATPase subunit|uniref:ABC transporter ATP-binding protein n=1 Tax=Halarcobacter anaerophilus TaxID=877500 RepID=A0A4Q0XZJ3_9BACT|nr:ABC transporter ATP-binding protein [Halarcobacter anaerophilus]QDF30084.1 iron(III)/spermidine/putrescine ABC transporter, ATP-binding protein [Halarcobacter anaerophilus]RXJ63130.1 ABC transporter ATP-binding protein [Halarcobacter anaerophilus]
MIGVSVKNFSVAFGNTKILENINFDVKQGEIVTILGPSGCGKSTILRSIASLHEDYDGDIFINDHCLINNGKKECHKDIGYIFQDYALFPHLNVKQNIEFALYNLKSNQKQKRVDKLLKQFDLVEHRNKQIHELSGGQQQRVSIARVLAYEPKVLLLDEPFSNLDTILRNKTKIWLKKLIKELNLSAILVTHDQKEALSMSDRIAIINNKRVEQFGTPQELYTKPKSLYVANFLNKINVLPNLLLESLNIKISSENVGIIPIGKVEVSNAISTIKAAILDVSFCGDYYELNISLKEYENMEMTVQVKSMQALENKKECYLNLNNEDIKIVRKNI